MLTEPSTGSTTIQGNHCSLALPEVSLLTRSGLLHVSPPSRETIRKTSGSPFRVSAQQTYTEPRSLPVVVSTPIEGKPSARPNPLMGKSQPAQSVMTLFLLKLTPASVDLVKNK